MSEKIKKVSKHQTKLPELIMGEVCESKKSWKKKISFFESHVNKLEQYTKIDELQLCEGLQLEQVADVLKMTHRVKCSPWSNSYSTSLSLEILPLTAMSFQTAMHIWGKTPKQHQFLSFILWTEKPRLTCSGKPSNWIFVNKYFKRNSNFKKQIQGSSMRNCKVQIKLKGILETAKVIMAKWLVDLDCWLSDKMDGGNQTL